MIYIQSQLCSEADVVCTCFQDAYGMIIYNLQFLLHGSNLLFLPTVPQIRCSSVSKHIGRVTHHVSNQTVRAMTLLDIFQAGGWVANGIQWFVLPGVIQLPTFGGSNTGNV